MKRLFTHINLAAEKSILELLSILCEQENIKIKPNILQLDPSISPFVFGFFKPVIILPCGIKKEQLKFVLMHELQHIKHKHLYIKLLMNLLVVVYWWFPVTWILNKVLSESLEYQADYYATKKFLKVEKINYLETLIEFARGQFRHTNILMPLSFSSNEQILKKRISTLNNLIHDLHQDRLLFFQKISFTIALSLFLFPFFFTFEAEYAPTFEQIDGGMFIESENSYFIKNQMKMYELYIDDTYFHTFEFIPSEFENIEIIQPSNKETVIKR